MLVLRPGTIREARRFIREHHSHLPRLVGGLFAIAVEDDGRLCGVAVVGRPVSRMLALDPFCLELTRVATDRTPNVSSMLAAAAWRTARGMGCRRLVTYTLEGEAGTTYRAAGFQDAGPTVRSGSWSTREGRDGQDQSAVVGVSKRRWERRVD